MSLIWRALAPAALACVACAARVGEGDGKGYLGGDAGYIGDEAGVLTCNVQLSNIECTGSAPSYATDVAPILGAYCTGCHNPNGEYPSIRLDTYAQATNRMHISTALSLIASCQMPPPPLPAVSNPDAATLYCWISSCLSGKCVK